MFDPKDPLLYCETSLVLARVNDLGSVFGVVNVVESVTAQIFASEFDCQFWVHRATLRRINPPCLLIALCRKLHEILVALPCRRSIFQRGLSFGLLLCLRRRYQLPVALGLLVLAIVADFNDLIWTDLSDVDALAAHRLPVLCVHVDLIIEPHVVHMQPLFLYQHVGRVRTANRVLAIRVFEIFRVVERYMLPMVVDCTDPAFIFAVEQLRKVNLADKAHLVGLDLDNDSLCTGDQKSKVLVCTEENVLYLTDAR